MFPGKTVQDFFSRENGTGFFPGKAVPDLSGKAVPNLSGKTVPDLSGKAVPDFFPGKAVPDLSGKSGVDIYVFFKEKIKKFNW